MSDANGHTLEGVGENSPEAKDGASPILLPILLVSLGTICDVTTKSVKEPGTEACE